MDKEQLSDNATKSHAAWKVSVEARKNQPRHPVVRGEWTNIFTHPVRTFNHWRQCTSHCFDTIYYVEIPRALAAPAFGIGVYNAWVHRYELATLYLAVGVLLRALSYFASTTLGYEGFFLDQAMAISNLSEKTSSLLSKLAAEPDPEEMKKLVKAKLAAAFNISLDQIQEMGDGLIGIEAEPGSELEEKLKSAGGVPQGSKPSKDQARLLRDFVKKRNDDILS